MILQTASMTCETLSDDLVVKCDSAFHSVIGESPFKRAFLVTLMGARLGERLAEFMAFMRIRKAAGAELSSLMLGLPKDLYY